MKKLILPIFALITYASTAQFSIVPQVGMEMFRTTIKSNNFSCFSPVGQQFAPVLSAQMAYNSKSGQGAFVGIATSSPAVNLKFTDPLYAKTAYTASTEALQLRLEAGYQFTSKPITLKKAVYTKAFSGRMLQRSGNDQRPACTRSMHCAHNPGSLYSNGALAASRQSGGIYMRVKPSLGLALAPLGSEIKTEIKGEQTTYAYRAGWNTALVAGTAFEIGSRSKARFVLTINYLKSLGLNTQTLTNNEAFKPTVSNFSSKTSGFSISLGMPLTFKKKTALVQNQQLNAPLHYGHCIRYRLYQ